MAPVLVTLRPAVCEPSAPPALFSRPTLACTSATAASVPPWLIRLPALTFAVPAADTVPLVLSIVPSRASSSRLRAAIVPA